MAPRRLPAAAPADGVIIQAAGTTLLAKLCFEKAARLAEVGDTMGSLRDKFGEFYGPRRPPGP